jgi:hypothetical protein
MPGCKWRVGIVFETQLDSFRDCLPSDLSHHAQAEINARRDPAGSDHVTIFHDSAPLMLRANEGQQLGKGPVRGCAASPEEPGHAENECPGTYDPVTTRRVFIGTLAGGSSPRRSPPGRSRP